MKKGLWMHLVVVAGISTVAAPAIASPPTGTISPFTGNIASTACINPEGLTIDSHGNLYTGSANGAPTGAVCEFKSDGAFKRSIPIPAGPGRLVSLLGVLFEGPHTLFALDFADTLVPTGGKTDGRVLSIDTLTGSVTTIASGFSFPNGIAEDLRGNLYVADSFQGTVTRMGQDGSNKTVWSASPLLSGNPAAPLPIGANGIAFDLLFQNVYVSNTSYQQIIRIPVECDGSAGTAQVFANGEHIDQTQSTTNALDGADGIAFDLFGNLYVAANANAEIQVISPSAQLIARYANPSLPVDVPASLVFLGDQLYFTNLSLFDKGVNSSIAVLQAPLPGLPPL
ncbi:MAG TPA: SMP-30/gluconolactonase/LRE family protein [Polyangiaceae bacterium]|nr:SMP-30/gluconolactonase/LRE family protein [Polyangiaceae bacterium]